MPNCSGTGARHAPCRRSVARQIVAHPLEFGAGINNPLKHAPHTAASLISDGWNRSYSREVGAFPLASLKQVKYWPPVGRVDNVLGDRNLFCACVPVADCA